MRPWWRTFKGFWNAEEVPRWFGLSLVLIYLVGLGAVAQFGMTRIKRDAYRDLVQSVSYSVELAADRLARLTDGSPNDGKARGGYQRALREFASHVPARRVRIVDGTRRVVASVDVSEIGVIADDPVTGNLQPTRLEVSAIPGGRRGQSDRWIRAPIRSRSARGPTSLPPGPSASSESESSKADADAIAPLFLEVRIGPEPYGRSGLGQHSTVLIAVLVVLGALFVIHRRLREHFRGLSRIGDRLLTSRDSIEADLAALRIADVDDTCTDAWNELIDLVERLTESASRRDASEELSQALKRSSGGALAEALNTLPDGIVYVGGEMRFEYLNASARRLFGWSQDEATNVTLPEARAAGQGATVLDLLRSARLPDGGFETKTELIETQEGDAAAGVLRVWVLPVKAARRSCACLVVIRDVSQQIRAERVREEFVTQVTHELRTPLTNIRAYAETLSSGMFDDPKVITECYNVITKETRRLSRLIEDILSVSQLEVGSIELEIDNVDLRTLLGDGVRDVRGLADEKNIDLQLSLPAKLESICGDRDKLAVVVNNLLGNAIKYTPAGGEIVVGCQVTEGAMTITVKDNGIGIDPEDHGRVFEKFQRADDPEVKNEAGSGIGLFTAREIARRHGGDIEVVSQKGKGATFLVRLPHRKSRAGALVTEAEA